VTLRQKLNKSWNKLGPGLVTGASDDDPSGIATYSQAGAAYGLSTLWTALVAFPLMAAMQQMCAKIGIVTSQGLTGTLKKHYPRPVLYLMLLFSFPAIVMNIGANIAAMGAVGSMLKPTIGASFFSVFFTLLLLGLIIYLPYRRMASILKYLCIAIMVYLLVPFLTSQDLTSIIKATFIPKFQLTKEYLAVLVGILGTTLSPYLFFWQASVEVEEMRNNKRQILVDKKIIQDMEQDVDSGMAFSGLIMYFIILTTGTVLFNAGLHDIHTVEEAAAALKPLAGDAAYLLFSIGIIGTKRLLCDYCYFAIARIGVELRGDFTYGCIALHGHTLWHHGSCTHRHHPAHIKQQKYHGRVCERKRIEHPWVRRFVHHDRRCIVVALLAVFLKLVGSKW